MNIINLVVSISFLVIAFLFYLLRNWIPNHEKKQDDDDYGDRALRFGRKFKLWSIIIMCIIASIAYLIEAI
jgi:hypothetical protein